MISRITVQNGRNPTKKLGALVEFLDHLRRPVTESQRNSGPYPYYGANGQQGTIDGFLFDEPLTLLAEDGGHFDNPARGIAYRVSGKTWVNNHAHVLRAKSEIDRGYLCRVLENYDVSPFVTGTTRGKLTKAGAAEIPVPLPPLPEQRRIAAVLDQADALRAKRREALAQLDSLTQSVFIEMFGDPARNTHDLPLASLGNLGVWQSGGTPPRGQAAFFQGQIPWFSSGELESMYVYESREHLSHEAIARTSAKRVPRGALMLGMYDTAALKAGIAGVEASCNQAIAFSKLNDKRATSEYVYYAITIGREHFRRLQRGVRQKNLNLSMIREIDIPLPSLEMQHKFLKELECAREITRVHAQSATLLDSLFHSLQHRAFSGEL